MARKKAASTHGKVGVWRRCKSSGTQHNYVRNRSEGVSAVGTKRTKQCRKCHQWYIL
jgi:hypothetical protein